MITHLVFFRLKDTSPEGLARTRGVLLDMEGKIPDLLELEAGINVIPQGRAYDIALVTKFPTREALDAYQVHPEHQKVLAYMKEALREPSVSVDYESEPKDL
ncbi:Dabb family protein [Gorillibacterium sp. sgz500922]|uniref:Dabb family protein n=1 Tax=Gorillibacterium sp. sgz500922 TaxID=3446694 RepID=UPI003F6610F5